MATRAYLSTVGTALRQWLDQQPKPHAIEKLAEATGVPLRSLYRYAQDERTPPLKHAIEITRVTGLSQESLIVPETSERRQRARRQRAARRAREAVSDDQAAE